MATGQMQHQQRRVFGFALWILLLICSEFVGAESLAEWKTRRRRIEQQEAELEQINRRAATTVGTPTTPTPIQSGQVSGCIGWRYIQSGDTCDNLVTRFASINLTKPNLLAWNPALKNDCSGLTSKTYVCVQRSTAVPSTTIRTTTSITISISTPSPIQAGQVSGCIGWRYVASTDTCDNIVSRFAAAPIGLTKPNLLTWNPALKSDCSGLTIKTFICVQRGASPPSTTLKTTTTTSTVPTPSPVQSGQASGCIGWRYVQSGDTCDNIVSRFVVAPVSLTKLNLLAWNPALGSDCSGLTLKTFVCVQRAPGSPTVTTTMSTLTADCVPYAPTGSPQMHAVVGQTYDDIPPSFLGYIDGYNETAKLTGMTMNITSNSTGETYTVLYDFRGFPNYISAVFKNGTNIIIHDETAPAKLRSTCGGTQKRNLESRALGTAWIEPPTFDVKVAVVDRCNSKLSGLNPVVACTYDPTQYFGGLVRISPERQYLNEWTESIYTGSCTFPRIANVANSYGCTTVAASHIVEICAQVTKWSTVEKISCFVAFITQPEFIPVCLEVVVAMGKFCNGINKLKKIDDNTNGAISKAFCSPPPNVIDLSVSVGNFLPGDLTLALSWIQWNPYTGEVPSEVSLQATISALPEDPCPTSTTTRTTTSSRSTTRSSSMSTTSASNTVSVSPTTPTYSHVIPTQSTGPFKGMPLCVPPGKEIDFTTSQYSNCGINATDPSIYSCTNLYDYYTPAYPGSGQGSFYITWIEYKSPPFPGVVSTFWQYLAAPPYPSYGNYWSCGITMQCPTPGCGKWGGDTVSSQVTLGWSTDFDGTVVGTFPNPWPQQIIQPCDKINCPGRCPFGQFLKTPEMECSV
ncbi:hypothetical protein TWF696_004217 [Orbilia brochopaga]|uniref:LysM domain-containing protein n=1 Tax=Orbilia brochopaga TaxID=3140254 RepID=A0AAV9V9B4_9PEZI